MISRAHGLHHQFSPPSPIQSSLRQAVGSTAEQTETGNRIIGGVSIFRSPVSAIRCLVLVFRFGCRFRKSVLCHRFSPPFISVGRWQPRVAGGGCSALLHRLSHLSSALCHRFSHRFNYVVTRSRPYPGKPGQYGVLPLPQDKHSPYTPYSILFVYLAQPPTAYRQPLSHLIDFTNVSCGACLLVFQPPGSAV
jgi:hypothetical protein